jgi:hypothetical protein
LVTWLQLCVKPAGAFAARFGFTLSSAVITSLCRDWSCVMSRTALVLAALGTLVFAAQAAAHHSGAMYNAQETRSVDAVVKELQWTNPHSWIAVTYQDAEGRVQEVDLELGSPVQLVRQGWRPKVLVPGDKVKIDFHPHRDGAKTGLLVTVTLPNGTTLTSD